MLFETSHVPQLPVNAPFLKAWLLFALATHTDVDSPHPVELRVQDDSHTLADSPACYAKYTALIQSRSVMIQLRLRGQPTLRIRQNEE